MAHPSRLTGRRGWTAVVGLSAVLSVLVVGQLPAAAQSTPLAPVGNALRVIAPALAASPQPQTPSAAPVAAPVTRVARVVGPTAGPARPVAPAATTSAGDRLSPAEAAASTARAAAAVKAAAAQAAARKAAAGKAAATAADRCSGDGWQERRGRAALASLKGGAERTGFRVQFAGARKGYMGLTHLDERRIEMFVRPCGTQSDELLRHVMAHELGHAYDTTRMSAATRRAWQVARGIPLSTPWYGCSGCTDFATPAGDFAEVYAQWARGASTNRSQLAGDVPSARLAELARQFFGA